MLFFVSASLVPTFFFWGRREHKKFPPNLTAKKTTTRPRQKPVIRYQTLEVLPCVKGFGLANGMGALQEVLLHRPVSLAALCSGEKMSSELLSEFQFSNSQMSQWWLVSSSHHLMPEWLRHILVACFCCKPSCGLSHYPCVLCQTLSPGPELAVGLVISWIYFFFHSTVFNWTFSLCCDHKQETMK